MPMANGAAGVVGSPVSKWQLALAVGAPVALGLGYMYYRNASTKSDRETSKDTGKSNGIGTEKQISIDGGFTGAAPPSVDETPTERAQRYKNLGNIVFKAGKYDEAIAHYNMAIEACPKDNKSDLATFYQNRAAAYEQLKKYTAVKEDCTRALELKPKYVKALLRRARAMERMNKLELVLEDVTAACLLEQFQNQSTLQMADRVLKKLGKQHAQEHMENKVPVMPGKHFVKTYFGSFKRDPLISEKTESTILDEIATKALKKARQALKEQRYDDIIPICTEEIERVGNKDLSIEMQLRLLRATFYTLLGQHELAMADLGVVIDSVDSSNAVKVNALINRASLFMQLEKHDECFDDYKKAIEIDADCSDIYHHRGQMNLLLDRIEEAKEDSSKALSLNPDFGVGYAQMCYVNYRYAMTKRSVELQSEAMRNFEKSFEKFPNTSECHTLYAQVLADSQKFDEADEHFATASMMDPENSTILVHRGLLQLQWKGDVTKGIDFIQKALEIDEKSAFGYETLATIEVQRGNLKEAIELFDKALALGRSAMELTHIFSLQDAAKAQLKVMERLGAELTWMPQGMA
ncbi:mitochondrial import receptor subunit TOM70 [Venturia canescens]|uniref:mitochondrial import receptor subunit TOM70 n=1 Tax=Venturia canescens TaxID=32260 RepID=UPI001C9D1E47|nr:mitochondrial import receptor subunit TOM70 [Venturia canescens]